MKFKYQQLTPALLLFAFLSGGCATVPIEVSPSTDLKITDSSTQKVVEPSFTVKNYYDEPQTKGVVIAPDSAALPKPASVLLAKASSETPPLVADSMPVIVEEVNATVPPLVQESTPVIREEESLPTTENEAPRISDEVIVITRTNDNDRELTIVDSISYLVLVRPNDYLQKIAAREYNNPGQWRNIYQWNEELIGSDPNVIHAYTELELFKPEDEIDEISYDYIIHEVSRGETLWSIAKDWYGDNLAWKLVYSDNSEVFNSSSGRLISGMELKIRTNLVDTHEDARNLSSTN